MQRFKQDLNLCFSIFKGIITACALFRRLVNRQRLFSDELLGVIQNACEFALEDDATLSYAEEKLLRSMQEQIGQLFPDTVQEQEQQPTMELTM